MQIFTPKTVRIGGWLVCASAALLLNGGHQLGYLVGVGVSVFAWQFGAKAFAFLSKFADPQFWPTFVSLGVATLFAAHRGGWLGLLAVAGVLVVYDGMYFAQNY